MTRLLCVVGLVGGMLVGVPGGAAAQSPADSYFHEAAQAYVDGDELTAQRAVEQGLQVAPSDPRLEALKKRLQEGDRSRQQQDSSATESSDQSQQGENESSEEASEGGGSDSASASDEEGASQSGDEDESSEQSSNRSSQSQQEQNDEQSFTPNDSTRAEERQQGGGQSRDTLSRDQAEQLLRALEGQERQLLRQLRSRSSKPRSVEKDW